MGFRVQVLSGQTRKSCGLFPQVYLRCLVRSPGLEKVFPHLLHVGLFSAITNDNPDDEDDDDFHTM